MNLWIKLLVAVAFVACPPWPHAATGEEVVIEDRIGEPMSTNGNIAMGSEIFGFDVAATVGKFRPTQNVRLTKIQGVGVPYTSTGPQSIGQYGWKLAIHSTEDGAVNSVLNGDILVATDLPAPTTQVVGTDYRGYPSYLVSFDFASAPGLSNLNLSSNIDYWFSVVGVSAVEWDWVESETPGFSDFLVIDNTLIWAWDSRPGFLTGRAALKFIGETLPLPGDYDRDNDVDGADFLKWQREFGSTLPRYDGSDGNGDGTVDAADYVVWRDNYGTGSGLSAQVQVPEPNMLTLAGVASLCAIGFIPRLYGRRGRPTYLSGKSRSTRRLTVVALLVCAFSTHAATGEEVVIEDRIGDPASTEDRSSMESCLCGSAVLATVGKHRISESARLTKIEGIGVPYSYANGPVPIGTYGWKLAIHSTESNSIGATLNGDILSATSLPAPTIQAAGHNSHGFPSYHVSFDFSSTPGLDNIFLNGGTYYWISVLGVSSTSWDWMESVAAGDSDFWVIDNSFAWVWTSQGDLPTGRAALKFIGDTLPIPGDYDRDEDVDGRDFLKWQREFGSTLPRYDGSDGNGDGTVDAADYVVWRDNYGTGSGLSAQVQVPEPNMLTLAGVASLCAIRFIPRLYRRRGRPTYLSGKSRSTRRLTVVALLVCAFSTHAAMAEVVVIEDRIGLPESVDGNISMFSVIKQSFGGGYGITGGEITPTQRIRLSQIEGVGASYNALGTPQSFENYGWRLTVHSSLVHISSDPLNGDIAVLDIDVNPIADLVGTSGYGDPLFLVRFELVDSEVVLEASEDYFVSIAALPDTGEWDWAESELAGSTDFSFANVTDGGVLVRAWSAQPGFVTGRAALKFIGETLPLPGDYDRDDDVDGADFLKWQREFGSTLPRYDGADGNGNGTVDAADYVVWRDNYGVEGNSALQAAVPEPEALSLFILALALTALWTRFTCR